MKLHESHKRIIANLSYTALDLLGVPHEKKYRLLGQRVRILQWRRIARKPVSPENADATGPVIKMLPMIGNMYITNFELPLAAALAQRGADVEMVFCDGSRPLCELTTVDALEKQPKEKICEKCCSNIRSMTKPLSNIKISYLSDYVGPAKNKSLRELAHSVPFERIASFEYKGIAVGKAAYQTACRHLRVGIIQKGEAEEDKLRNFLHSSLITCEVAKCLDSRNKIDSIMMSHGIYASWAPALEYFLKKNIYAVTYDRQAKKNTWIFNANMPCRLADISEAFNTRWRNRMLTAEEKETALSYLRSREDFSQDSMKLGSGVRLEKREICERFGLNPDIPLITMFTNNMWDAASVGRDLVFKNPLDWIAKTIRFVGEYQGRLQLLIKPHPAEKIRGTRQAVGSEIRKIFPDIPSNVVLLAPDVEINSTSIMRATDLGVVHTSTVGMEMSIFGIPVVVVSWTHYRGYGFTFDPSNEAEYFKMIRNPEILQKNLSEEKRALALKYFYVRFFKYCLDIPLLKENKHLDCYGFNFSDLRDLRTGRYKDLDFVCNGILRKTPDFVKE